MPGKIDSADEAIGVSGEHELSPLQLMERRLAETQRIARIGSFEWDLESGLVWCSDETYKLHELSPENGPISVETLFATVREDYRAAVRRQIEDAVRSGTEYHGIFPFTTLLGNERWIRLSGELLEGEDGRPLRFVGTTQDMTALRDAEQKLSEAAAKIVEAEEGLRRVLEDQSDYVVRFDAKGAIIYANPAYCRAANARLEALVGRYFARTHLRREQERTMAELMQLTPDVPSRSVEQRVPHRDGGQRWINWVDTAVYFDSAGKPTVFQSSGRDITRHVDTEKRLRSALAEVESLKDRLSRENVLLKQEFSLQRVGRELIGKSPPMKRLRQAIAKVAETSAPVLITGETGTGKELVAEAIHAGSQRRDAPLVKVNCAVLSPHLVESELFGHVKGAFTGATAQRIGRLELADGATLFLDEVGELPLETQAKLLRAIENGTFERLGSSETMQADVRIIAATNRDLRSSTALGEFREDLFWRLNVFPLALPPLRERGQDIPDMAEHFFAWATKTHNRPLRGIAPEAMKSIMSNHWPGNVRELKNAMERAVIAADGQWLEKDDIAFAQTSLHGADDTTLDAQMRAHIVRTLELTHWVVGGAHGAAKHLGMKESTLRSRMTRLGIARAAPRSHERSG